MDDVGEKNLYAFLFRSKSLESLRISSGLRKYASSLLISGKLLSASDRSISDHKREGTVIWRSNPNLRFSRSEIMISKTARLGGGFSTHFLSMLQRGKIKKEGEVFND